MKLSAIDFIDICHHIPGVKLFYFGQARKLAQQLAQIDLNKQNCQHKLPSDEKYKN